VINSCVSGTVLTTLFEDMGAGGSKSYSCLMKALHYIKDPAARVLIVRQTYPMLKISGGLWDESFGMYPLFGGVPKVQKMTWVFPNGATVQFAALPDNIKDWQGLQASHILVDEAAEFRESEIIFLLSRLRSAKYQGHLNLTMTCNPDNSSFLFKWVEYCLDEDGIPKEGTENITRYFIAENNAIRWGDSVEELYEKYGSGKTLGVDFIPKSFRFIPLTVYDNPVLLKNNPAYLANLLAQSRVDQLRYLYGSWTARDVGSMYFSRDWCEIVDYPPTNVTKRVRSYDLAGTEKSPMSKDNPDYTAGVKMSKDSMGIYYVEDAYRFRKLTDGVLKEVISTAKADGLDDCVVGIVRDGGAGGAAANMFFVRQLAEQGIAARSTKMSGHSGKVQRFLPFAAMAEAGCVKIVRGPWNDTFLNELESFTGGRSGHDDQVDATSDAFNMIAKSIQLPTFVLPNFTKPSISNQLSVD